MSTRFRRAPADGERGQALILMVFGMTVIFLVAAVVIDVSLWLSERRSVQRAADMAVMAGVQELPGEVDAAKAIAREWAKKNGFENGVDGVAVSPKTHCKNTHLDNPAVSCLNLSGGFGPDLVCPSGCDTLQVTISKPASLLFASIFGIDSFDIEAGASAVCAGCVVGGSAGGAPPPRFVTVPRALDCSAGDPDVDGRVLDSEGYTHIGDLVSATTYVDYGDALATCDGTDYYFALRLNGPTTGGAVANENVYACEDPGEPLIDPPSISTLRGIVTSFIPHPFGLPILSPVGFVLESIDDVWTIRVDPDTNYGIGLDGIDDLEIGSAVQVEGTLEVPPPPEQDYVQASDILLTSGGFCTAQTDPAYHSTFGTGWDLAPLSRHNLKDLVGSDRARFQLNCDGAPVHDFIQDYLRGGRRGWASDVDRAGNGFPILAGPDQSASSIEWNLEHTELTGWGDEPGENAIGQSPPFDPSYPTFDSQYDAFVWEVIYEFRIRMDGYAGCNTILFGLQDFAGATVPLNGMHNSPAKTADGGNLVVVPMRAMLVE